jgi:HAD superfamily hydrolase (TIGR01490 family)
MVRVRDILRFGYGQLLFRLQGEREGNMKKSQDSTLDFVSGRSQAELVSWGREIAEERVLPRVYQDIVRVIDEHKERGDLTFLVTAAPVELADVIAEALGMDGAIATRSEVDADGFYTGRLVDGVMHGPAKAKAVAEVAAERGIDLVECHAYSDSVNDLPLLESIGNPHAVNPEHELARIARVRGWPIHELRTRRRTLLIGIPAGLGGVTLLVSGVAIGVALERKQQASRRFTVAVRRKAREIRNSLPR